nr:hypothetical protein [Tanacetum cinerariifolium]
MATTIEEQVALDEAIVPSTKRLRIGRSNFKLPSDIQSKESTLQVVYDVLRRCPFFQAFLVTADVPIIYMQEFWATATVHHHSIRFKMNNKKHIINLETFRDMLHVTPQPVRVEVLQIWKKRGDSDTSLTPPITTSTPITTAAPVPRITASAKGKQPAKAKSSSDLSKEARTKMSDDEIDDGSDDGNDDDNDETVKDGSERDEDDDDNDKEEEIAKIDEPEDTESGRGGDEVT